MDIAASTLTSEATANLLRAALLSTVCPVCANQYSAPVSLPCGHSICRGCTRDVNHRCCVCSKPFRDKQLIVNSALESTVADLLALQAEISLLSAARAAPTPTPNPAAVVFTCTGDHSPTPISPEATPTPPRSVFECGDYVSVRNTLSYEMSQELLGRALENGATDPQDEKASAQDSWTERSPAGNEATWPGREPSGPVASPDVFPAPVAERSVSGNGLRPVSMAPPTLTPEISFTQLQPMSIASPADITAVVRPEVGVPCGDTETQPIELLATEASLPPSTPMTPEIEGVDPGRTGRDREMLGNPVSTVASAVGGAAGRSPVRPMGLPDDDTNEFTINGPTADYSAFSPGCPSATPPTLTPSAVSTVIHSDDHAPYAGLRENPFEPDLTPSGPSTMEVGSIDPWGIQIRNELRELKARIRHQLQSPEPAQHTMQSPKRIKTMETLESAEPGPADSVDPSTLLPPSSAPEDTLPPPDETVGAGTDVEFAPYYAPLTPAEAIPVLASPDTRVEIICHVATEELSSRSIAKLQACRDHGYINYGNLSTFHDDGICARSKIYNIFVVDCKELQGRLKLCSRSVMYIKALCAGVYIVDSSWLDAVLEAGHAVAPDPFEVHGSLGDKVTGGPNRARVQHRNSEGQLFLLHGISFALDLESGSGSTKQYRLSEGDIRWIIYFCGGEVVALGDSMTDSRHRIRLVRSGAQSTTLEDVAHNSLVRPGNTPRYLSCSIII